MLQPTPDIRIPDNEIEEQFIHASGPGGQNVNKVASAVQLRFNVAASPSLPEPVKARLQRLTASRLTEEGTLIIEARRFRSQMKNREDAYARLSRWIQQAAEAPPKPRRPTRPSRAARERRRQDKRQRGQRKRLRKSPPPDAD